MTASVDVLLRKIGEGVAEVRGHYEANLAAKQMSDELLYAIRNIVQDSQSALDWTATAVKDKFYPGSKWRPYFPLTKDAAAFPGEMEKQIKGLAADHPAVAAAFERQQPYQRGNAELGYLHVLAKVNKHQDFTPQTRQEQRRIEITSGGIDISFPAPGQHTGVEIQFGGDLSVHGRPLDPQTLLPLDGGPKPYTETIYVLWRFNNPAVSVLPTLEALATLVRAAVEDVRSEAQL
jgi:hypothetical protein